MRFFFLFVLVKPVSINLLLIFFFVATVLLLLLYKSY